MRRILPIAALATAAALVQAVPRHAAASPADAGDTRVAANQRARAHDLSVRHGQALALRSVSPPGVANGQSLRR